MCFPPNNVCSKLMNYEGIFVLAQTIPLSLVYSVAAGEALGLFHALQWLSDM